MAKKRTVDPWMPAPAYGASLTGFGVNLLIVDIPAAIAFATTVLEAVTIHTDPDSRSYAAISP